VPVRIISSLHDAEGACRAALDAVKRGRIILFPTETVYGLGVDSRNPRAIEKLYRLKERAREKPFQWLVADVEAARAASPGWNELADKLTRAFWPGPLTLVVRARKGTIGWRMPQHEWLLEFLRQLGRPLIATSANRSGGRPVQSCAEAVKLFGSRIGVAMDGGEIREGRVSTVMSVVRGKPEMLRGGAIPEEEIQRVLDG